jgi:transcriptional regulator with XRE-family HTH domain
MANISPIQQRIIELKDKEGLSYKEIGERVDLKYNTVKNYYHKGMAVQRATAAAFDTAPDDNLPAPITKPLSATDMADELEKKAHRILQSISDVNLATASLYQKASSMGVFIDKARLLRGESTQNVSVKDMRKVNDLLPVLMREAKRRNLIVDAEFEEVE